MFQPSRHLARFAAGLAASIVCCAVHAQSSVTLYGVADAFVGSRQLAGAARATTMGSGGMTTSQWGIRGQEDLGGGLKTVFDLSGFLRLDSGASGRFTNDTMFSRTTSLGLQGGWGTLRAGRITTPNFISSIRLNPFGDSTTFSPFNLHTYLGGQPMDASVASGGPAGISDSAHNAVLAYTSPSLGGVVAALNHSLAGVAGGKDKRTGYSLTYGQGPLLVSLSGESINNPTLPAAPVVPAVNQKQGQDTVQLGASFDFGAGKLFGQWSRTTVDLPSAAERRFRTVQLGASVPMGAGKWLVSVAQTRKTEAGLNNLQRTTWAVGHDYDLSKRTDLYAVYMNDRLTDKSSGNTLAVGVRHRF